ncbi:aminoglycoside phosphotransferase [Streptomyces sp. TRM68367]|uniref:aminoglycoside phosphotransferase n=1 Tax=Streptomyces sp. TRM68367 TaxID=2758415 RepID=UPI00165AB58D|nr:aminoglycoside phosphotransferase [Streptomyces sp. TRM68367]MBC9730551.1 aminoglycoside phosphotransferase [Streptomyces sp. TRM68367]
MDLQRLRQAFARSAEAFGCQVVDGVRAEGWRGRTLGGKVAADGLARWVRVVVAPADKVSEKLWTGNESAQVIAGASRPELVEFRDWVEEGLRFRAELSTFVEDSPVSVTPELRGPVRLAESWWKGLEMSLDAVAMTATDRVSVRQDLVNRRLEWLSGGRVAPEVTVWKASHGDLHWANLTAPACVLLDWEGWGLAPAGWDVAVLRAYSLLQPVVAAEIADRFSGLLTGSGGRQVQLFAVAELLMAGSRGDHPELTPPLLDLASELLDEPAEVIARRVGPPAA